MPSFCFRLQVSRNYTSSRRTSVSESGSISVGHSSAALEVRKAMFGRRSVSPDGALGKPSKAKRCFYALRASHGLREAAHRRFTVYLSTTATYANIGYAAFPQAARQQVQRSAAYCRAAVSTALMMAYSRPKAVDIGAACHSGCISASDTSHLHGLLRACGCMFEGRGGAKQPFGTTGAQVAGHAGGACHVFVLEQARRRVAFNMICLAYLPTTACAHQPWPLGPPTPRRPVRRASTAFARACMRANRFRGSTGRSSVGEATRMYLQACD